MNIVLTILQVEIELFKARSGAADGFGAGRSRVHTTRYALKTLESYQFMSALSFILYCFMRIW
jgi:hypothetical protein